jgi:ABC-2 type transport system ATP-binding protein
VSSDLVIQVARLRKTYGSLVAVEDISFEVHAGEIFGMVGPNGAGKTTTIECMEGMRQADSGTLRILGLDPVKQERELRLRIGVQLRQAAIHDRMRVWEAMDLFANFYPHPAPWEPLLEQLGLIEKRDSYFSKLSGGQKQRLFIALALVGDPELVFLDELTTGLDPHARHAMWDLVRGVRDRGKVVFLTTHFMEEAERLCDRVAIVDHGKVVALDTPEKLVAGLGGGNQVVFSAEGDIPALMRGVEGVRIVENIAGRHIITGDGDMLVVNVVTALVKAGVRFRDLRTEQPNLEDVFLKLTGREMRPEG